MRILLRIVRFESADALDKQDQGRGDDKTDPGDPNGVGGASAYTQARNTSERIRGEA
ncbi:MAG: hypothetical protein K6F49_13040 [Saccharofermentans sp.]|nr:hypothetical protein [Saccharofermentans sp.]